MAGLEMDQLSFQMYVFGDSANVQVMFGKEAYKCTFVLNNLFISIQPIWHQVQEDAWSI